MYVILFSLTHSRDSHNYIGVKSDSVTTAESDCVRLRQEVEGEVAGVDEGGVDEGGVDERGVDEGGVVKGAVDERGVDERVVDEGVVDGGVVDECVALRVSFVGLMGGRLSVCSLIDSTLMGGFGGLKEEVCVCVAIFVGLIGSLIFGIILIVLTDVLAIGKWSNEDSEGVFF